MPLVRQTVPLQLRSGIDTKTDAKVVAGKLLTLENAVFTKPGALRKRNGFAPLGRRVAGADALLEDGQALATYRGELLAFDSDTLHSYDAGGEKWVDKGGLVSVRVTTASVAQPLVNAIDSQDGATHSGGLQAYAWKEIPTSGEGSVRYSIVDSVSGQIVVPSTLCSLTAVCPRVLVAGGLFVFLYANVTDGKLYVGSLPVATPTAAISFVAVTNAVSDANSLGTTYAYDAAVIETAAGPQIFVAFDSKAPGGAISLWRFLASAPTNPVGKATFTGDTAQAITVFGCAFDGTVIVAYWNGAAVMFRAQPEALVDASAATLPAHAFGVIETIDDVRSITGVSVSDTALDLRFFYAAGDVFTTPYGDYLTRTAGVTGAYTVSALGLALGIPFCEITRAPAAFLRSVFLSGKAFAHGGAAYVTVGHSSALQSTYFVADGDGRIVARVLAGTAGVAIASTGTGPLMLPSAASVDVSTWRLSLLQGGAANEVGLLTGSGVVSVTLDFFDPETSYSRAELGQGLHLGGGLLWHYDGSAPVEHGFLLFPEGVSVPNPGGALTYQYRACYEWTDAQNLVHRSAPSVAVSHTTGTATSGASTVAVTIPTLRVTNKIGTSVRCIVYRTINNGTVFYRASAATETPNVPTADTVTFTDAVTDAVLLGRTQLYTTGDVVENLAPPPIGSLTVHRNRVVALDSTNPLTLWYSKQATPGAPVEFSDLFTLNIDPRGGDVTAVASLDDKLVVFKRASIFIVTGQGPDATGAQSDFSDALLVTTDCGCVNPRSVVTVPAGLMFASTKGIYLLDRSLVASYAGADVEAFNGETVTSAALLQTANQVRFTLGNGVALVFDYLAAPTGQWSVFTGVSAVDSVIWDGEHAYLRDDGAVMRETPGVFTDGGSHIPLRLVTSWLQFANLQGYQRLRNALILGEYFGGHRLRVSVAYDFNPEPAQEDFIEPAAVTAYGDDATYGSGSPYGGEFPKYQWRINFARQKCSALRLSIEDVQDGTPGESMSLSGITLEVAVKRGANKVGASQSVG